MYRFSLSLTHAHTHSKTVLMFECMRSSLPTLPLPPPLHSGDALSVTAVLYYDDVIITSCSLNLILFLTIYSNTVMSSYHHHVAYWGQSVCSLFCVQFFQFFHPDSLINYYYYLTTFNDFYIIMINNHSLFTVALIIHHRLVTKLLHYSYSQLSYIPSSN
jgi:hypothetical protein